MPDEEILDTEPPELTIPPEPPKGRRGGRRGIFRRFSDRTPLRTKLVAAVLALVIMALAAISVASVVMLRNYVVTRQDNTLKSEFAYYLNQPTSADGSLNLPETGRPPNLSYIVPGYAYNSGSNVVWALQQPGTQIRWYTSFEPGGNSGGNSVEAPLPQLPTGTSWASPPNGTLRTVSAQTGPDSWRVIAETLSYPVTDPTTQVTKQESLTLVAAFDLGDINAMTNRLVLFDLVVGGAIVVVLAIVAIGIVRANLRSLDDIELTAGQIAAGHLGHRVPEGDPRTEIGSLGRSLNTMLSQIERAFHSQEAAERSAHESEERMRRFIADAAHELRTPLTTIRGFAAHYRQRGGARGFLTQGSSAESQNRSSITGAAVSAFASGASGAGHGEGAGESARTVIGAAMRTNGAGPGTNGSEPNGTGGGANGAGSGAGGAGGPAGEDLDHLMARVEAEAIRMGMLVEDLLTLARLDQQRPLAAGPVDLLTLAVDAVHDARIVSPERPIDLVVAPGTAFIVNGDESRLRQVLANLVNNALTHTPAGTPIRVKIASGTVVPPPRSAGGLAAEAGAADPDAFAETGAANEAGTPDVVGGIESLAGGGNPVPAVVLDIEDDGPGMSADQAQRVFERFYRADAARNRASGGTGLGLAIVAGLVAAHGGTVAVRTAPGDGADFQVRLPLSPDALAGDPEDE